MDNRQTELRKEILENVKLLKKDLDELKRNFNQDLFFIQILLKLEINRLKKYKNDN